VGRRAGLPGLVAEALCQTLAELGAGCHTIAAMRGMVLRGAPDPAVLCQLLQGIGTGRFEQPPARGRFGFVHLGVPPISTTPVRIQRGLA